MSGLERAKPLTSFMDLANVATIQNLLRQHHIAPNKRLGQHFLILPEIASIMTEAAGVTTDDTVLEIGPGLGALTCALARRAGRVIAVEKDVRLARILCGLLKENGVSNVEVIEGDILQEIQMPNAKCQMANKVVADIPYYLTARLLRLLLEPKIPNSKFSTKGRSASGGKILDSIVLMVQKEVAERICASPPRMSLLSVSVQYFAGADTVQAVPKSAFWPEPEVDSAILRIVPKKTPQEAPDDTSRFFAVLKAGFRHPRKHLANNLKKEFGWNANETERRFHACNISLKARPQELDSRGWLCLHQTANELTL